MKRVLELFSGSAIVSRAFKRYGWETITVDHDIRRGPDIVADCRQLPLEPYGFDCLWASPPCTEFSLGNNNSPYKTVTVDLTCLEAVQKIVMIYQPRFWIIENVRGAQRWLGRPELQCGSVFLWGQFPWFEPYYHVKATQTNRGVDIRAMLPWSIPYRLVKAINDCIGY